MNKSRRLILPISLLFLMGHGITLMGQTKWTEVATHADSGSTAYVDIEGIRERGGYVYYWQILNYAKKDNGTMSAKLYNQGDCDPSRWKLINFITFTNFTIT